MSDKASDALADEIEQSVGLLMMLPGNGGTRSLGIKKTAQIIAALRTPAQPAGMREALTYDDQVEMLRLADDIAGAEISDLDQPQSEIVVRALRMCADAILALPAERPAVAQAARARIDRLEEERNVLQETIFMSEEIKPHIYSPDYQATGDCRVCGHAMNRPWHLYTTPQSTAGVKAEPDLPFRCNCPHEVRVACSEPRCPHYKAARVPFIKGFSALGDNCVEVWFSDKATEADRAWLLDAIIEKAATPAQPAGMRDDIDAKRYRRLQILGCAPGYSPQLADGSVLRFTGLDAYVDADISTHPSRGEAALPAERPAVAHPIRELEDDAFRGGLSAEAYDVVAPAQDVWQPIETAPKGRLLIVGFFNSAGKWRSMHAQYRDDLPQHDDAGDDDGPAEAGWYEGSLEAEMLFPVSPTHWMPLPASPVTSTHGATDA